MVGHGKPCTTLDAYSDLLDDDFDAVAEALTKM